MLFLFRGKYGPAVRALAGLLLLVASVVAHGGAIMVAAGVALVGWGAIGALNDQRARRQAQADAERRGRVS